MLKVVLSGGPCSGKSTAMAKIKEEITQRKEGFQVFIVPEIATELSAGGIKPSEDISGEAFQEAIVDLQIYKENLYLDMIQKHCDTDKVVLLYDRGLLDQLAYISREQLEVFLSKHNMTLADVNNRYDAILHLVSLAKDNPEKYNEKCKNNPARTENAEQAADKDNKTLAGNMNHPHVRVIDNLSDFDGKIQKVLEHICAMLGVPVPSEIERKYLIEKPDEALLESVEFISKSEIIQTYLRTIENGTERRVRQRGTEQDGYSFYYTEKTAKSDTERIENERIISMREYVEYLADADPALHQVRKTRYCFIYENQYFELDIYPYSEKYAIVEIELVNEQQEVKLPDFLKIIKEVTTDSRYKNSTIAKEQTIDI